MEKRNSVPNGALYFLSWAVIGVEDRKCTGGDGGGGAPNREEKSTQKARVHHVVGFKTNVLHSKVENTPTKDTNGKRKFKRMLSFLFVDKRKLFAMTLSFEEFNLVFYRSELRLACVEPTRQRGF